MIGSTQRSIEILSYIDKKKKHCSGVGLGILRIGIGRSSEFSVSDRFWKTGIVASLFEMGSRSLMVREAESKSKGRGFES